MSCTRNPFTPFVETFSHSQALPWIKMDVLQIFKCSIQQITFFHFMASMVLSIMLHSAILKKKKSPVAKRSLLKASRESSGLILVFTVHGFSVRTNASLDSAVALLFIIMFSKWKGWIAPSPDSKRKLGTTCWLPVIKWNLMWQMLQMPFSRRESHEGPCSTLCHQPWGWWKHFPWWSHLLYTSAPSFPHARHN